MGNGVGGKWSPPSETASIAVDQHRQDTLARPLDDARKTFRVTDMLVSGDMEARNNAGNSDQDWSSSFTCPV